MENNTPRITRISQQTLPDENNMPKVYIVVEYMVGPHGPFTEKFLKDNYTPAAAKAQLAQAAAQINGLAY